MSAKDYKGNPRKGIWENERFQKGINYTNEPLRAGSVKMMANLDLNKTGSVLRPRSPYFSAAFNINNGSPFGMSKHTIQFKPYQDPNKEFFIEFNGPRRESIELDLGIIAYATDLVIQSGGSGSSDSDTAFEGIVIGGA